MGYKKRNAIYNYSWDIWCIGMWLTKHMIRVCLKTGSYTPPLTLIQYFLWESLLITVSCGFCTMGPTCTESVVQMKGDTVQVRKNMAWIWMGYNGIPHITVQYNGIWMGYNGIPHTSWMIHITVLPITVRYTPSCGETPDPNSTRRMTTFFCLYSEVPGITIWKYLKIPLHTPIKNSSPRKTSQVVLNPTNLGFAPCHFELPTSTSQLFAI